MVASRFSKSKPDQSAIFYPLRKNRPSKYRPPSGDLYLENCPQIQSKNGKCTSLASPIEFEMQIFLRI